MKISIFTEGGKSIGIGHLTRCIGLSQKIQEIHPEAKLKFIVQGDGSVKKVFASYDLKVTLMDWCKEKIKLFELAEESQFVIIDSYLADKFIYEKISNLTSGRLLMVDDFKRLSYPQGVVLNPSVYGGRLNYPDERGVKYLLGKNYIVLRKEFWVDSRKVINKEIKDVLVTFGGMKRPEFIKKVLQFLVKGYAFNIHVVLAKGSYESDDLLTFSPKIKIYRNISANDMRGLMERSDICISGGGQTVYELARIGLPTIGILFADNQKGNLETLEEAGFLEYAGRYEDKEIWKEISQGIQNLEAFQIRQRKSEIGRALVDGQGAERIVDYIWSYAMKEISLREVREEDCLDLWQWRNDPKVRKWCFNAKEIPYNDHKQWFAGKLKDKRTKVYICLNEQGEKIGQARFDFEDNKAHINVNLNPKNFGEKYGNRMIKASTEKILKEKPILKEIIAEIKEQNVASKKAFEKAGYVAQGHTMRNGKNITIYHYKK